MPTPKTSTKPPTARSIAAKVRAEEGKQRKLHVIAERRAGAKGMTKKDYIAAIVEGKYRGITAEEIAAEPDPGIPEVAAVEAPAGATV